jgi:hypothetical protein
MGINGNRNIGTFTKPKVRAKEGSEYYIRDTAKEASLDKTIPKKSDLLATNPDNRITDLKTSMIIDKYESEASHAPPKTKMKPNSHTNSIVDMDFLIGNMTKTIDVVPSNNNNFI